MSDRVNLNEGVIEKLLGTVRYIVIAKNGTFIPCVNFTRFQIIHRDLPAILLNLRRKQVANLTEKFHDGWRLSHGNGDGDLPEFSSYHTVQGNPILKVYANERLPDDAPLDAHKFQQFQEYDVSMMLKQELKAKQVTLDEQKSIKVKGSKEMVDLGATRVLVDECFEHAYFSLEHYRTIESNDYGTLNPWVFVLFSLPEIQDMVKLDKLEDFKRQFASNVLNEKPDLGPKQKKEVTTAWTLDKLGTVPADIKGAKITSKTMPDLQQEIIKMVFDHNNFVEDKKIGSSLVRKETFNKIQVTVLVPATRKRPRRNSLIIANTTFNQIMQPPPPQPQPQLQPQQPNQ